MTATSPLNRIRAYLSSDMRTMRWILVGLYIAVIVALIGIAAFQSLDSVAGILILLGITIAAQALFILGAGTIQLCRPIKRRRLWMPVLASSLAFAVLVAGFFFAIGELFKLDTGPQSDFYGIIFLAFLIFSWIAWGVLIFTYARKWHRYRVLSRLSSTLFAAVCSSYWRRFHPT